MMEKCDAEASATVTLVVMIESHPAMDVSVDTLGTVGGPRNSAIRRANGGIRHRRC